jgi:hypothetical protein
MQAPELQQNNAAALHEQNDLMRTLENLRRSLSLPVEHSQPI